MESIISFCSKVFFSQLSGKENQGHPSRLAPFVPVKQTMCFLTYHEGGLQLPQQHAGQEKQSSFSQEIKLIICICYIYNILRIKYTINIYKHSMLYSILLNSLILPFHFIITLQNKKHYQHILCQIIAFLFFVFLPPLRNVVHTQNIQKR